MGSDAHVIVHGGRDQWLLVTARALIEELERRWSRFLPASEVSRFNASAPGERVVVSQATLTLVLLARRAWELTDGLYDPTVLPSLRAAGYDADFAIVRERAPVADEIEFRRAPGCDVIVIDAVACTLTKQADVEFDPGGIGKGLAADIVATALLEDGATGALVSLGGDVRARGPGPTGSPWSIDVAHPMRSEAILHCGIDDGAVATSTSLRRRWLRAGAMQHHMIDPRTGAPSSSTLVAVTAVANDGWWAEAATKAVFVAGKRAADIALPEVHVATVDLEGQVDCSAGLTLAAS
jgi:thiamine biosynthesis lipoprotein